MMKILIKNHIYLYFIPFVQLVCGYVYTNENGITIKYDINFKNKCRSGDGRIAILQGLPIAECVAECGLRQHCASLNYRRREHVCELFSLAGEGDVRKGDCIFIPASDITVQENPCDDQDCTNYKTCDAVSKTCTHKECPNDMVLQNGEIRGNTNDVGDTIKYDCNSGYEEKNGIENAVCLATGQWNQAAECVSVCGDLPSVGNGHVTQDPASMNIASLLCDAGYQTNSTIINCLHDTRSWESVTCEPIACGNIPTINNGNDVLDVADGNLYLDTASVSCDAGYQSSVDPISCTATGSWETASCERKSCGSLPSLANGNIALSIPDANKYLDLATVSCDVTYVASKTPISCTAAGTWEAVSCDVISCGTTPTISNGNTVLDVVGSNLYLDTASVSCITGYQSSVGTITCTASGSWKTATCDRISCGNPPSISNGNVVLNTLNGNNYLDQATVTCDGTYIASTNVIICKETGLWESATCDVITCGNPPSIANGQYTLNTPGGQSYQDTATVTCDNWFQASASFIYCTASGSWSEATCTDVQCYPTTSEEYRGKISYTTSGRLCQRWDSQFPHPHSDNDLYYFPDATLDEASNYCRNLSLGTTIPGVTPWILTWNGSTATYQAVVTYTMPVMSMTDLLNLNSTTSFHWTFSEYLNPYTAKLSKWTSPSSIFGLFYCHF